MSDSGKCVEVSINLSADNIPDALRDAIESSGMSPEAYMDAATENIQSIVTLLRSCVDLYEDKKLALEHLGFSFVSGVTITGNTGSHASVSKVLCGSLTGIVFSLRSLFQDAMEDVIGDAVKNFFEG